MFMRLWSTGTFHVIGRNDKTMARQLLSGLNVYLLQDVAIVSLRDMKVHRHEWKVDANCNMILNNEWNKRIENVFELDIWNIFFRVVERGCLEKRV